jgi:hypothetical protein
MTELDYDALYNRLRPLTGWFRLRERLVRRFAKFLDVPVAVFWASQPPFDYSSPKDGDRYLIFFRRYNHIRDGQRI